MPQLRQYLYKSELQCAVAMCCSVLQCIAVYCSVLQCGCSVLQSVVTCLGCCNQFNECHYIYTRVCCSVAMCCSVSQCVFTCSEFLRSISRMRPFVLESLLQCVAVCCNALQCVVVCCSVLQCAVTCWGF